jgi:hypothetical protein
MSCEIAAASPRAVVDSSVLGSFSTSPLAITRIAEHVCCNDLRLAEIAHKIIVGRFTCQPILRTAWEYSPRECRSPHREQIPTPSKPFNFLIDRPLIKNSRPPRSARLAGTLTGATPSDTLTSSARQRARDSKPERGNAPAEDPNR